MSLGPVNNNSSNRLSQLRQTEVQRTQSQTETSATTSPTTTTPAAEIERAPIDPAIQSGAREAQRGLEDTIKGRLEQIMEGAGGSGPRRGLGGPSLEGEQFVNKRTGKGRRTAATESAGDKNQQLARADGQNGTSSEVQNAAEQSIQLAGKRTGSGTRIGLGDDAPPLPGERETGFA